MVVNTVAVTGGSGKIGGATLAHLDDCGYETVNLDRRERREGASDAYLETDLLDAGEVYGSLAKSGADAVVHLGTIPSPTRHPAHVTYESNVLSSQHVLEAAQGLGVERVCLASSVNAMGSAYQRAPTDVRYLPVDEAHPLTPRDEYGIAKHVVEVTADGYGRCERPPSTISSLRFPWVCTTDEMREAFAEADRSVDALREGGSHTARDALFSYLHVEDAARAARRCVEADFEGHEVFWTVAADTAADAPTADLVEAFYPDAEVRESIPGHRALVDAGKAAATLGWEPERSWRDLG